MGVVPFLPGPWALVAPIRPAGGPLGRGEEPRAGAKRRGAGSVVILIAAVRA